MKLSEPVTHTEGRYSGDITLFTTNGKGFIYYVNNKANILKKTP